MIDEWRVRQMAVQYQMNPSLARKLLEEAGKADALERGRRYREAVGGDVGGSKTLVKHDRTRDQ